MVRSCVTGRCRDEAARTMTSPGRGSGPTFPSAGEMPSFGVCLTSCHSNGYLASCEGCILGFGGLGLRRVATLTEAATEAADDLSELDQTTAETA